jgi:head-tail adaptor
MFRLVESLDVLSDRLSLPVVQSSDAPRETLHVTVESLEAELAASTEQLIAGQVAARLSHTITLRYRAALLPTAQLVLQPSGRVFEVVSVLDTDERHRELTVMALERV